MSKNSLQNFEHHNHFKNLLQEDEDFDRLIYKNAFKDLLHMNNIIKDFTIKDFPCAMFFYNEDAYTIPELKIIVQNKDLQEFENDIDIKPGEEIEIPKYKTKMIVESVSTHSMNASIILRPKIFYGLHQTEFKIFQKKTLKVIIEEICQDINVKCSIKSFKRNPEMELMVRYNETLINFLNRCCFLIGCHWTYDMKLSEIVISQLDALSVEPIKNINATDSINFIDNKHRIDKSGGRFISYDSKNPQADLNSEIKDPKGNFNYNEIFSHDVLNKQDSETLLNFINNSYEKSFISFICKFQLSLFQKISIGGKNYFVTKIQHFIGDFVYKKFTHGSESFYIEAKDTVHFKDFVQPIASNQKAKVVIPENGSFKDEIFKDQMHRVMVQFLFDKDKIQVPVPVSQQLAFENHGVCFMPKVDTEVIVEFINGNPNCPVISGCLHNAKNIHPFPIEKYGWIFQSLGSKTRTHELSLSMENEKELTTMSFPKDIYMSSYDGSLTMLLDAKNNKKGNWSVTMNDGDFSFIIKKGNQKIEVENGKVSVIISDELSIEAKNIKIQTMEDIMYTIGRNSTTMISGNSVQNVNGTTTMTTSALAVESKGPIVITGAVLTIMSQGPFAINSGGPINMASPVFNCTCGIVNISSGSIMMNAGTIIQNSGMILSSGTSIINGTAIINKGMLFGVWIPA